MKRLHFLLFAALLALSLGLVLRRRAPHVATLVEPHATRGALTEFALPGAALVATLDLDALRASVWGRIALERLLPLASQTEPCARAALNQVTRLTLAIPAEGSTSAAPELAVIAEGPLQAALVLDCATRVLREQGAEPEPGKLGSFQRLRDKRGRGELVVRNGGPLILSAGSYLRTLVERSDAGRGQGDDAREQLHAALRRELKPAPLLLTWVLASGWLERWLDDPEVKRSPLAEVRALSLRGDVREQLSLDAVIAAETVEGAQRIETFLLATQAELGPLLEKTLGPSESQNLSTTRNGSRIELHVQVDAGALLASWFEPALPPDEPDSHPLGSAHAQEPEPQP